VIYVKRIGQSLNESLSVIAWGKKEETITTTTSTTTIATNFINHHAPSTLFDAGGNKILPSVYPHTII
jgi:hypothetical protein